MNIENAKQTVKMKKEWAEGNATEQMDDIIKSMERRLEDLKRCSKDFKETKQVTSIEEFVGELENCSANFRHRDLTRIAGQLSSFIGEAYTLENIVDLR